MSLIEGHGEGEVHSGSWKRTHEKIEIFLSLFFV